MADAEIVLEVVAIGTRMMAVAAATTEDVSVDGTMTKGIRGTTLPVEIRMISKDSNSRSRSSNKSNVMNNPSCSREVEEAE